MDILASGESSGRALSHNILRQGKFADPDHLQKPTIPFTRIPKHIFLPDRWVPLCSGRWAPMDHITVGEGRAVIAMLQKAALCHQLHGTTPFNLEDNMPISGAFAKGRSSTWSINYLCRRKSAYSLAASLHLLLPWIETKLQPADALSRQCRL